MNNEKQTPQNPVETYVIPDLDKLEQETWIEPEASQPHEPTAAPELNPRAAGDPGRLVDTQVPDRQETHQVADREGLDGAMGREAAARLVVQDRPPEG